MPHDLVNLLLTAFFAVAMTAGGVLGGRFFGAHPGRAAISVLIGFLIMSLIQAAGMLNELVLTLILVLATGFSGWALKLQPKQIIAITLAAILISYFINFCIGFWDGFTSALQKP